MHEGPLRNWCNLNTISSSKMCVQHRLAILHRRLSEDVPALAPARVHDLAAVTDDVLRRHGVVAEAQHKPVTHVVRAGGQR